ncbi:MAG TPA: SAM-dependent methyltransferase [Acidimicrobiales bacterium]
MSDWREPSTPVDRHVPHASRIYDYLLGGTDHFEVDRQAAEAAGRLMPGGIESGKAQVRANRDFLVRAVTYLVNEAGIRQFLDIGTGVPNADNVHAVAQGLAPESRIVYVDNDPTVLAHAEAMLASTPEGAAAYIDGDLRHPAKILREARDTLDFEQPVALMLVSVLHFLTAEDRPHDIVRQLVDALPSGSYLALTHLTDDMPEFADLVAGVRKLSEMTQETFVMRPHGEVARFFEGLDLVEPGLVAVHEWRPDRPDMTATHFYGGVARKP